MHPSTATTVVIDEAAVLSDISRRAQNSKAVRLDLKVRDAALKPIDGS